MFRVYAQPHEAAFDGFVDEDLDSLRAKPRERAICGTVRGPLSFKLLSKVNMPPDSWAFWSDWKGVNRMPRSTGGVVSSIRTTPHLRVSGFGYVSLT